MRWSASCGSSSVAMAETFRIQTLNNISARGLERLPRERYEVASGIERPDAVLVRSADMHKMELSDSVLAVARAGAGTNNIPVAALAARGIPVFNTPGANANAVKELVIAGIFMGARNIGPAWQFARAQTGDDKAIDAAVEKGKKAFVGFELPGRTLGVIGLGAIGVEVANCALALGMKVLGYDPQITVKRAWELSSSVQQALSLDDLFARSDVITVHVPLNDATRGLVNAPRIALMRKGGVVLNFARGGLIVDADLIAAVKAKTIAGAILDVFRTEPLPSDHPFWTTEGITVLPHIGGGHPTRDSMVAELFTENARRYLAGENLKEVVDRERGY